MRDNNVYDQLVKVIHDEIDPALEGYCRSRVSQLAYAILSFFDVTPIIKKHRPCSCGSQFKIYRENYNGWILICDNEGSCCEIISVHIKGNNMEDAWKAWDGGKW